MWWCNHLFNLSNLRSNIWHLLFVQFSQSGQGSYVLIFEHCVGNCTMMCITPSWHNITSIVQTSIQSYVQYMLETAQFISELSASVKAFADYS
jgi:hypothetical protein